MAMSNFMGRATVEGSLIYLKLIRGLAQHRRVGSWYPLSSETTLNGATFGETLPNSHLALMGICGAISTPRRPIAVGTLLEYCTSSGIPLHPHRPTPPALLAWSLAEGGFASCFKPC